MNSDSFGEIEDTQIEEKIPIAQEQTYRTQLLLCMERLVDYFVICDLENDQYKYYRLDPEQKRPITGKYSELVMQVAGRFQTLEKSGNLITCLSGEEIRANLQKESDIYKFEYCSIKEDTFWMASFIPMEWKDHILTSVVWVAMDITDEKKKEIRATNEFLSHMSHNIRNPINAMLGLTALAAANLDDRERTLGYLRKITKSGRQLMYLINEVLDMASVKSGRILLVEEEQDLACISQADYSGKRVLIVEDNDLNREIAAEIVGLSRAEVDCARNGKEAVEKIEFSPEGWYNLVLMDIQMPIMNGYEATAAIRSLPGRRGRIPIVATTANAFAEDVQMAKNTGMNEHIAKPLEVSKINEVLRRWLS